MRGVKGEFTVLELPLTKEKVERSNIGVPGQNENSIVGHSSTIGPGRSVGVGRLWRLRHIPQKRTLNDGHCAIVPRWPRVRPCPLSKGKRLAPPPVSALTLSGGRAVRAFYLCTLLKAI